MYDVISHSPPLVFLVWSCKLKSIIIKQLHFDWPPYYFHVLANCFISKGRFSNRNEREDVVGLV